MNVEPLYRLEGIRAAYHLRYAWTGWFKGKTLISDSVIEEVRSLWENDGIRLLEYCQDGDEIQMALSATPCVSPLFLAGRVKGRLQHALRRAVPEFSGFSRKVAIRSIGDNTRQDVEAYVARQVAKEGFVDPRFRTFMEQFTVRCTDVDLSLPSESLRGRYWYNLHVVLVVTERYRIVDDQRLQCLLNGCLKIAAKKGHRIAIVSVMPDHIHMAIRGNLEHSPQEIALGFQNNLAYFLGQIKIWDESFYVGTFSEYDMGAIRTRTR